MILKNIKIIFMSDEMPRMGARACVRPDGALRVSTRSCSGRLDRQDPEIGLENVNGGARALFPHSALNPSTAMGDPVHAPGATSAWSSRLHLNGKWQV